MQLGRFHGLLPMAHQLGQNLCPGLEVAGDAHHAKPAVQQLEYTGCSAPVQRPELGLGLYMTYRLGLPDGCGVCIPNMLHSGMSRGAPSLHILSKSLASFIVSFSRSCLGSQT